MVGWPVMIFLLRSTSCGLKVFLSLSLVLSFNDSSSRGVWVSRVILYSCSSDKVVENQTSIRYTLEVKRPLNKNRPMELLIINPCMKISARLGLVLLVKVHKFHSRHWRIGKKYARQIGSFSPSFTVKIKDVNELPPTSNFNGVKPGSHKRWDR